MRRTHWLPAASLVGLMALHGASVSGEPGTGLWLLESCRGDYGDDGKAFCLGYSMGLADLMFGQQKICMSPDVTSEQIRLAVEGYLRGHPQQLNQHPAMLVIEALGSSFPCR